MKKLALTISLALTPLLAALAGCTESAAPPPDELDAGTADAQVQFDEGKLIDVAVPASGRVYVKLATPTVVTPKNAATSTSWDLAFEGADVFTNSGPSGPGKGGGFGPLSGLVDTRKAPEVPFIQADKTGGAFLDWYAYAGTTHQLFSRYHVVGIQTKGKLFKVQILGYYGLEEGAPTSAVFQLRYAEVTKSGVGETLTLEGVDGRAGGLSADPSVPSACLDLASGKQMMLTPDDATKSSAWDLCFRRENVSVNGGDSGPRGDGAVDLQAAATATETLDDVEKETADSEAKRLDDVDDATLTSDKLHYRGDGTVSIFTDAWLADGKSPIEPAYAAWVVTAADGATNYLVIFESFDGATATSPGTLHLRVVPFTA